MGAADSLARAYGEAVYEVALERGRVALSVKGVVDGQAGWLPGASLTVVTAYNPGRARPSAAANAAANRRLEAVLREGGQRVYAAVGRSADWRHAEPSYAVAGLDRAAARELGARFGQAAVFFWEGGRGEIVWISRELC